MAYQFKNIHDRLSRFTFGTTKHIFNLLSCYCAVLRQAPINERYSLSTQLLASKTRLRGG